MKAQKEKIKETYSQLANEFKATKSEKVFAKLYKKMYPNLRNYVYNVVKDYDTAEDIVSETLTKIHQRIDEYDPQYQITTWAYRIAYNDALQTLRKKQKNISLSVFMDKGFDSVEGYSSRDNKTFIEFSYEHDLFKSEKVVVMEDNILQAKYETALKEIYKLKDIYKIIIIDRLLNDLSYDEIKIKWNAPNIGKYEEMQETYKKLLSLNKTVEADVMKNEIKKYKKKFIINGQTVKNRVRRGKIILSEKLNSQDFEKCLANL